jgi:trehalose-phosphatase
MPHGETVEPDNRLLLATDFDGTIAPIHHDPAAVQIDPSVAEFLSRAAQLPGVTVAVISGRDAADLRKRIGNLAAWISGSHGHEIVAPDGSPVRNTPPIAANPPEELREEIARAGARIETKRYGVALHWRGVVGLSEEHPLVARFARWATGAGLEPMQGRMVLEARLPGTDKGEALQELARLSGAGRIVYAGDDITDLPALAVAAEKGSAFFVRSAEREAPSLEGVTLVASTAELIAAWEHELRRSR